MHPFAASLHLETKRRQRRTDACQPCRKSDDATGRHIRNRRKIGDFPDPAGCSEKRKSSAARSQVLLVRYSRPHSSLQPTDEKW